MKEREKKIYLALRLDKSTVGKDINGDFIFDVEASNENLDLEQQKVLQRALLDSKDYFLSNGFISKDHLHQKIVGEGNNKKLIYDEDFIIGEPIDVYTKGTSTRVKGKLYKNNDYAKKFIKLLEEGSTRVKASVGGLLPVVKKVKENGEEIEKVISVLWNDLALTISPVNPTVSSAFIIKSLNSSEFIKALSAGYGTDSATFTGGRAITREDIGNKKKELKVDKRLLLFLTKIIQGKINNEKEAKDVLSKIYREKKWSLDDIVKTINENRKEIEEVLPMIKWEDMFPFMKKSKTKQAEEEVLNLEEEEITDEEDDEGDVDELEKVSKALSNLNAKVEEMSKMMEEGQEYLAKAINANRQSIEDILGVPKPRTSAVNSIETVAKGGYGNRQKLWHKQFTTENKEITLEILEKATQTGEISLNDFIKIENQINKSIVDSNFQIDQKYIALLQTKMREAENIK